MIFGCEQNPAARPVYGEMIEIPAIARERHGVNQLQRGRLLAIA
jgi:hypothetical protein